MAVVQGDLDVQEHNRMLEVKIQVAVLEEQVVVQALLLIPAVRE